MNPNLTVLILITLPHFLQKEKGSDKVMFWKRFCLRHLVKRNHSTKRSRIRRGTDGKNSMLKAVGDDSGNEGVLGKRKLGQESVDPNKVRKKRKIRGNNGVYDVDRISELPEAIIHHIFGFMRCTKDVARTSILSRKWKNMFNSYLVFDFDERWFRLPMGRGKHNRIKAREVQKKKFKAYVEKSLATRLASVPCIEKFRLYVNNNSHVLGGNMGNWIRAALEKNVKELNIHVNLKKNLYLLPISVLISKSITSLKLSGSLLFGFSPVKLSNLRELSIKDVSAVTEYVIEKIKESCPLIEDLRFVCCRGFLRLAISSHPKLRRVEIHECSKLSSIEIASSNLETFWYHAKKHQQCKIDLKGSGNLKMLTLKDYKMTDAVFQDCISKCPLLEKLVLHECSSMESLAILSGKLKSLTVIECGKLKEVNIDAPNMYSFQYSGNKLPFYSMNVLGLREAKFSFGPVMKTSQCIVEYQKLFGNFDRAKGFKLIVYSKQIMKIYEEPREAHLVPNYFCKLELTASSTSVQKIVDNWLWECHGRSLILISPSNELIKEEKDQKYEKKMAIFIGPWGGPGGNYWDDGGYTGVREIMIIWGLCIDSIRILYDKNGTPVLSAKHGGNGGHINAEVKLQFPSEYLTCVSGYVGPLPGCGTMVRSLTFKSNWRTYGPFGTESGTPFSVPIEGGKIVGFRGRCGSFVDAIGCHITQV